MNSENMKFDDFQLEINLRKIGNKLVSEIIGLESLGEVQRSISNNSTLVHENLDAQLRIGDSGMESSSSIFDSSSSNFSIESSFDFSILGLHPRSDSSRSEDKDSIIEIDEEELTAEFRNYIKSKEFQRTNHAYLRHFNMAGRPVLADVLKLNEKVEINLDKLDLHNIIENLGPYDIILKKVQSCCDIISLLANQRISIDSFLMTLPENPKPVNLWLNMKRNSRLDILIFDLVQIGKTEQLRIARVIQSIENYFEKIKEKIEPCMVADQLLGSLVELDQYRMEHADALNAFHKQSAENDPSKEITVALSGLLESLKCVGSELWILKLKFIPDATVKN